MRFNEISIGILYEYSDEEIGALAEKWQITFDEARVRYYKENLSEVNRLLSLETRCICSMFARLMYENFKAYDCCFSKLIVRCCKRNENHGKYILCDGLLEMNVLFDYDAFFAKSDSEKKRDALSLISEALELVCERLGCDHLPFETVENMIISADYRNEWVWQTKSSPSRRFKARVVCEHEVEAMNIYLELLDKCDNVKVRKLAVSAKPDEWDYHMYLGRLKWLSKAHAVLYNKNVECVGEIVAG